MKNKLSRRTERSGIPTRFKEFGRKYPEIMQAYEALGNATQQAGPLGARTRALVKLGIAVGAWREGAVHSHTRRALEAGCTADEIRHVILLAGTTLALLLPVGVHPLVWGASVGVLAATLRITGTNFHRVR